MRFHYHLFIILFDFFKFPLWHTKIVVYFWDTGRIVGLILGHPLLDTFREVASYWASKYAFVLDYDVKETQTKYRRIAT